MSPLRFIGSLVAGRLSSRRICGQRLPMGGSHRSVVTVGALSLFGGGMWYLKDDSEEQTARKLNHQEVIQEDETFEEKAMKRRVEEWLLKYGRRYRDKEEKAMRYEIFKSAAQRVDELNSRPGALCTFETNDFADKTVKECC